MQASEHSMKWLSYKPLITHINTTVLWSQNSIKLVFLHQEPLMEDQRTTCICCSSTGFASLYPFRLSIFVCLKKNVLLNVGSLSWMCDCPYLHDPDNRTDDGHAGKSSSVLSSMVLACSSHYSFSIRAERERRSPVRTEFLTLGIAHAVGTHGWRSGNKRSVWWGTVERRVHLFFFF